MIYRSDRDWPHVAIAGGLCRRHAKPASFSISTRAPGPAAFEGQSRHRHRRGGHKFEVRHFLQEMLASAIHSNPHIDAATLWSWVLNTREYEWDQIGDDLAQAIDAWIAHDPGNRDFELFQVLLESSPSDEGPWMARNHYIHAVCRYPIDGLIEKLIELAKSESRKDLRRRFLEVIAYTARSETLWPVWEIRIIHLLKAAKGFSKFIYKVASRRSK